VAGSEVSANGRRVLIIDDEKDFTVSLSDILGTRGYRIAVANSRAEALLLLGNFSPEVCLVDIRLGRANGLDLIEEIARRPGTLTVMMTAYADTDSAIAALKAGAYDYLRKPFEMEDLFATLERGLERLNLVRERAEALNALKGSNNDLAALNSRLRSLVEAARRIAACRREDELRHALLTELASSMAAAGASLYMKREDSLELVCSLDADSALSSVKLPLPPENAIGRALFQRVPTLVKGASAVRQIAGKAWGGVADASLLIFPLISSAAEVLGIITVHKKRYPPFSNQDLDLGRIFTSLALEVMRSLQASEALRESEARYRTLFESAGDGIILLKDGAVVDCNERGLKMFDRTREEMLGAQLDEFSPELQPNGAVSAVSGREMYDGVAMGSTQAFEWLFVRKDGESFDAEVTLSKISLRGEPYVLSIVRDITVRKRADAREKQHERELFQASKLASLGTLVSGIAHEINNPNNFIRLSAQNLEELWSAALEVLDGDEARTPGLSLRGMPYASVRDIVKEMLLRVVEGSKRIERLVASLRDYARRDEGELGERVDINAVVSSALTILSNMVGKATTSFTLELAPSLPIVRGNNQQIEQVIINLLTNACQALGTRSDPISVSTTASPDGDSVIITIRDGGVGIPPQDLSRITDPFFTTKRNTGGTGLGLSISSRIVQNHGGNMEFSSSPGKGTVATVRLPVFPVSPEEAPA